MELTRRHPSAKWAHIRCADQNLIDAPVRFQANRLKSFFPSRWHHEHQIVYVKANLLKVAGAGGVNRGAIDDRVR
jgi:hypothetical protein